VSLVACSGGGKPAPRPDAGPRTQRRPKPPADDVRVYWPYGIRADGVGSYLIDAPLADVLHNLPEGPHIELLEIDGLLSFRIVRAEEGRMLIGADARSRVAFIAVLDAEVAKTDTGLAVGASGAELVKALGPERVDDAIVRYRRAFELDKLPNVTFLSEAAPDAAPDAAHVSAVLIAKPVAHPERKAPDGCRGGGALADVPALELWAAAHPGRPRPQVAPSVRFACVSGGEPEAVLLAGEELDIVGGSPAHLKRVWVATAGKLDVLAPLDVDGDGKDELVGLTVVRDDEAVATQVRVWGWDGGRLAPRVSARPHVVTKDQAAATGAALSGIELWPEVTAGGDAVMVGGIYAARTLAGARVVAPLTPVRVGLEPGRVEPPPPASAAGAPPDEPAAVPDAAPKRKPTP
jgi:hypothetical protein